jgi:hypothetical protein
MKKTYIQVEDIKIPIEICNFYSDCVVVYWADGSCSYDEIYKYSDFTYVEEEVNISDYTLKEYKAKQKAKQDYKQSEYEKFLKLFEDENGIRPITSFKPTFKCGFFLELCRIQDAWKLLEEPSLEDLEKIPNTVDLIKHKEEYLALCEWKSKLDDTRDTREKDFKDED